RCGRVPVVGGLVRFGSRPADVFLRDEVRGAERHLVVWVDRWKQLPDQGQRSNATASISARAARVPGHYERGAAAREVSRIRGVFRDLPPSDEADAIWMGEWGEAFPVRSPAQVGVGIQRPLGGAFESRRPAMREQSAKDGLDGLFLIRQRRLPLVI